MKTIIMTIMLTATIMALPLKAVWTGEYQRFTSPTGQIGIRCKYKLEGQGTFWRTFGGSNCPSVIEVQ